MNFSSAARPLSFLSLEFLLHEALRIKKGRYGCRYESTLE